MIHKLANLIHIFVDSGLPPILAYQSEDDDDGHAVAVVGHDIQRRGRFSALDLMPHDGMLRNSFFVDTFYVMDDARGPYAEFGVFKKTMPSLAKCDYVGLIAPIPEGVFLEYKDACSEFDAIANRWNTMLDALGVTRWSKKRLEGDAKNPLVLRVALLDSRNWKQQIIRSELALWLKSYYQAMLLPKYIWVIEISDWQHTNVSKRSDRRICGEAILDATANPYSTFDSLVSIHVKGIIGEASASRRFEFDFEEAPLGQSADWYPSLRRAL